MLAVSLWKVILEVTLQKDCFTIKIPNSSKLGLSPWQFHWRQDEICESNLPLLVAFFFLFLETYPCPHLQNQRKFHNYWRSGDILFCQFRRSEQTWRFWLVFLFCFLFLFLFFLYFLFVLFCFVGVFLLGRLVLKKRVGFFRSTYQTFLYSAWSKYRVSSVLTTIPLVISFGVAPTANDVSTTVGGVIFTSRLTSLNDSLFCSSTCCIHFSDCHRGHHINQYILSTWRDDWNGAVANTLHSVKERDVAPW